MQRMTQREKLLELLENCFYPISGDVTEEDLDMFSVPVEKGAGRVGAKRNLQSQAVQNEKYRQLDYIW